METTVTINQATARKLDKLCKAQKCTKKDFLKASLEYFEKYGISPLSHESPAQEMQKLIKRVDQIVAFIRHQEKEILRPACEVIKSNETHIRLSLENTLTKQELSNLLRPIMENIRMGTEQNRLINNLITQTKESQEQGFKIIAKLIDAKEKTGVFGDLSKIYSQK